MRAKIKDVTETTMTSTKQVMKKNKFYNLATVTDENYKLLHVP